MARKLIIMLVICLFILGCKGEDVDSGGADGSGVADEYVPKCTADDNCVGEQTCVNGTCTDPECAGCTYIDLATHTCEKYECCEDKGCGSAEKCSYNKCVGLECGECEYAENHACVSYKCCDDDDCDDEDSKTNDECENPGTAQARCLHMPTGDCGTSFSCFKDFLEDCDESQVVLELDSEDEQYEWEYELRMEIVDEDDDVCEILMEIVNVSVDLTNEYEDELEDEGKDEDEIQDILDYKNEDVDDYEGDKERCYIDVDDLDGMIDVLESWRDDDLFTMDVFDCDSLTP